MRDRMIHDIIGCYYYFVFFFLISHKEAYKFVFSYSSIKGVRALKYMFKTCDIYHLFSNFKLM